MRWREVWSLAHGVASAMAYVSKSCAGAAMLRVCVCARSKTHISLFCSLSLSLSLSLSTLSFLSLSSHTHTHNTHRYVHAQGIVHRDLKSFNVLIGAGGVPKICDFGLGKDVTAGSSAMQPSHTIGSVFWTAPEVLRGEKYTEKIDVYSFGVFLWELVTQRLPSCKGVPNRHALRVAATEGDFMCSFIV
jgi:serine/threonine protein kinase